MTRPPHPQEHCGHECVCIQYYEDNGVPCHLTGSGRCKYDTRSHSSPAAAPVMIRAPDSFAIRAADLVAHNEQIRQQAAAKERERISAELNARMDQRAYGAIEEYIRSLRGEQP